MAQGSYLGPSAVDVAVGSGKGSYEATSGSMMSFSVRECFDQATSSDVDAAGDRTSGVHQSDRYRPRYPAFIAHRTSFHAC